MSSGGLELGTLSGQIALDDTPLKKGLASAVAQLRGFEKNAGQAGEDAGKKLGDGLESEAKQAGKKAGKVTGDSLEAGVKSGAKDAGKKGGKALEGGFDAKGLGTRMGGMVAAGLAAATAGIAGIGAGWAAAMERSAARGKIAAQLGLTDAESLRAGQVAGDLYGKGLGESASGMVQAVGAVMSSIKGMRTASDADLTAATKSIEGIAEAYEMDAARVAQVTGQMISTGMAKDAKQGADMLMATLQKVPANVRDDIMDAVDEYGPFMRQLGLTGEQSMTMLANGAARGMYGIDKTGDALKEFTIRATDMSKATGSAYETLGLSQSKMTEELLAGGARGKKAFGQIIDGLTKIKDPAKQSQAALALFGTPLEDLNTGDIPKFLSGLKAGTQGLGNFAGASTKAADQVANSNPIERLKRTLSGGLADLINADAINGPLNQVVDMVGGLLSSLKGLAEWVDANKGWLGPIAAGITAMAVAWGAYVLITQGIPALLGAVQAAMALVNAVMMANPIGLIVLLLVGLVAAFIYAYNTSSEFRAVVDGALRAVWGVAQAVGAWFAGPFVGFFVSAGQWIGAQFQGIGQAFQAVGDWLVQKGNEVGNFFMNTLPGFFAAAARGIGDAFSAVGDFILSPIRSAVAGINSALRAVGAPQIPGFAAGGYTGPGRRNQVAGIAHAGEVVWSQDDVNRSGGWQAVDAARKAGLDAWQVKPPALAGRAAGATGAPATTTRNVTNNVTINNPVPEKGSRSITRVLATAAYLGLGEDDR